MPDEKKTWWEQWGKLCTVLMVTGALIGATVTAGMRISKLESRAAKVDDLMTAMQNLREVLLRNNIKWNPSEFPPIPPTAMSIRGGGEGRTLEQLDEWMDYCQRMLSSFDASLQSQQRQINELRTKVDPFRLQPIIPIGPVRPPSTVDCTVFDTEHGEECKTLPPRPPMPNPGGTP